MTVAPPEVIESIYPRHKNIHETGIEWLREVPTHWHFKKIKYCCQVRRGASPRPIDDLIYFDEKGEYAWVRISDVTASERYLLSTTERLSELGKVKSVPLKPGELFLSIAGSVGKPIITKIKCCIHDGFVYFVGLKLNREFLYYVFHCGEIYKGLGKIGTQLNLNTDWIGNITIPIPSDEEQHAIVSFLDRETARIDAMIAKKERLIALLEEKRTALISHAVTKGLDPTAPMKESGIPWLGDIPVHWTVKQLKYAITFQRGHDLPTVNRVDGNVPVVTSAGISGRHSHAVAKGPGIVTGRYGTIGIFYYISEDYWAHNTTLYSIAINGNSAKYLWYMLHNLKPIFLLNSTKSAVPGVDRNDLHPTLIALPSSLHEQQAIVNYLDEETSKIDELARTIQKGNDFLKEFRTALISAAVTGKIDVRTAMGLNG